MAYYGEVKDLPQDFERYSHNCSPDGECSGCGECCADMLPLTRKELKVLKRYAEKHHLKEHTQVPFFDKEATDLTCPFRDNIAKKCDVYSVRPQICREFICRKELQKAKEDRDALHVGRNVYSFRNEIFGNPSSINFIRRSMLEAAFKKL